jgi:hypothetical protein
MKPLFIYTTICSLTGIIPLIFGIYKFKIILEKYRFFIYYIFLGCVVDITGRVLVITHNYELSRVLSNVYIYVESVFFVLLFTKWSVIKKIKSSIALIIILTIVWITDNFIINSITNLNSIFNVFYSLITVLLSTILFQTEYVNISKNYFKDSLIIISSTLIINYSYRSVFESLYLFKLNFSNSFYFNAFLLFVILNVFSNCTFTFAIYCMDLRKRLTLYS